MTGEILPKAYLEGYYGIIRVVALIYILTKYVRVQIYVSPHFTPKNLPCRFFIVLAPK